MTCWKQNNKCVNAEIRRNNFTVSWFILTLDYDPDDKYWIYRDDPTPYIHWTDEYRAEILDNNRDYILTIKVKGRDEANALWKYLKHASLEEVKAKYANKE